MRLLAYLATPILVFLLRSSIAYSAEKTREPVLIGPVVFHWFGVGKQEKWGQYQTPWIPLEGREKWDGSVEFWERHTKYMIGARFNVILFQHAARFHAEEVNHLAAIRNLRDLGYATPKISPIFAAESFDCYLCQKDFSKQEGEELFYGRVKEFFEIYFASLDSDNVAYYDGKVLAALWWVPGAETAPPDFFEKINERLARDFGITAYWTTHEAWRNSNPDEINYLFNGMEPVRWNSKRNVDLLVGFWPPNLERYSENAFLPRNGGATYRKAWDEVIAVSACSPPPRLIFIESYNELPEGSGIYPAVPMLHTTGDSHWSGAVSLEKCFNEPCHPIPKSDSWAADVSADDAPYLYLKISAEKITDFFFTTNRENIICSSKE